MSKIKVKYKINNSSRECIGIKRKNKITFNDDNTKFSIVLDDDIVLKRTTDEYELILTFSNKDTCTYNLKHYGIMNIDIKRISLEHNKNNLKIKYELNDELFVFELSYEVIE